MKEVKHKAEISIVEMPCEICKKQNMVLWPDSEMEVIPPFYHHCPKCGCTKYFDTKYPHVELKSLGRILYLKIQ